MYPILKTERLLLKPLEENDFEDIFKLYSNPTVMKLMESELQSDPTVFKENHNSNVKNGNMSIIRLNKCDTFIDFISYFYHEFECQVKSLKTQN